MATAAPFAPSMGTTAGKTVKVTANSSPSSVSGSLDCTSVLGSSVLVFNSGTVLVWVRMSPEATPTATAADVPIGAASFRVLANPVPNGVCGLAVLSSTTTAADVYFTPGTGGN